MTRRNTLISKIAQRKKSHQGYRELQARLVRLTTQKLKREIRQGK